MRSVIGEYPQQFYNIYNVVEIINISVFISQQISPKLKGSSERETDNFSFFVYNYGLYESSDFISFRLLVCFRIQSNTCLNIFSAINLSPSPTECN